MEPPSLLLLPVLEENSQRSSGRRPRSTERFSFPPRSLSSASFCCSRWRGSRPPLRETETIIVGILRRIYTPLVEFAVAHRILALAAAGLLLALALVSVRFLGLEFLPHLEEGNLWIRATMPPSISLEEGNDFVNRMRLVIRNFPEVETVVSQQGRPDDGTDATGFFNAEFFAPL